MGVNVNDLLGILLVTLITGLLAFLAAMLLRIRQPVLGYIGAGLLGHMIGLWLAGALKANLPGSITLAGATVHLLWAFIGALLILLIVKLLGRANFRRP
jgi:uncharacterized membrane protein YeaQ/YmgE (transglycosylase-associated protein family)